jgi:hypothetical protein
MNFQCRTDGVSDNIAEGFMSDFYWFIHILLISFERTGSTLKFLVKQ